MKKSKISWCLKQKRGISLIDSNNSLSESYMERAEDDFDNLINQNDVWKIIFSYYICYNSFTSVLYKFGIKSEIHSCTIELLKSFDNLNSYVDFLDDLKNERENVQYYLKEPEEIDLGKVKLFLNSCKLEVNDINENKIKELKLKLK